ncbi:MAG TPA: FAD-binding oxidoreductase [Pseudonocardiaceae bacterium]|nr:FAD-binding oxidoreductase [Pseudonocardiaceae bacterium]
MEREQGQPRLLTGWGRTSPSAATVVTAREPADVVRAVESAGTRGVLARGLGRSYGDPAQNSGGVVIDMTGMDRIHSIDDAAGTVTADAGVSLDTLMRELLPHGLWLPVLPGTRQVTVGGAIGSDIHGKAHHVEGSFGNHVLSLDLACADGRIRTLTPDGPDADLFWATVGGMGLTGVVLGATLHVNRVETAYFLVDTDQEGSLDELMARQATHDDDYVESAAWLDVVTTGKHLGRGVLTRANHATVADLAGKHAEPLKFDAPHLPSVPDVFPPGMLNRFTARAFSEVWYRKSPTRHGVVQNITQFLHPLDVAANWNRIYGPRGFLQYQFVVPFGAEDAIREAVRTIAGSGHVSGLNVLKRFGAGNRAPLSFPTPGWTLCVDFPVRSGLNELCDRLDAVVLAAGGRLYLAKESRTTADTLQRMYPRIDEWRKIRAAADPTGIFSSDMSRRLAL